MEYQEIKELTTGIYQIGEFTVTSESLIYGLKENYLK